LGRLGAVPEKLMTGETTSGRKTFIPFAAGLPGVLGLIPFFAAASLYVWGKPELAGPALLTLLTYSCATLSFLGGLRWGHEMARTQPRIGVMLAACLPPLAAWLLLATPLDVGWQLGGFIAAFVLQWLWDAGSADLPRWWSRLRTLLTLGAGLALALAMETALSL
jgi:hypothetical protein